jgi:hypothetical protein
MFPMPTFVYYFDTGPLAKPSHSIAIHRFPQETNLGWDLGHYLYFLGEISNFGGGNLGSPLGQHLCDFRMCERFEIDVTLVRTLIRIACAMVSKSTSPWFAP